MTVERLIEYLADEALREVERSVDEALIVLCVMHPHSVARRRGQIRRFRKIAHASTGRSPAAGSHRSRSVEGVNPE
jgi:hypothetical protein